MKYILGMIICNLLFYSCNSSKKTTNIQFDASGSHVFIYKTKIDHFDHVPVTLSADKQKIIAYPHPSDLIVGGKLCLPTKLEKDYLLDNRGISVNVGFLNISYLNYSKLSTAPSINEMRPFLLDIDPLTELYDLGPRYRYKNIEKEINQIIRGNQLINFIKLK